MLCYYIIIAFLHFKERVMKSFFSKISILTLTATSLLFIATACGKNQTSESVTTHTHTYENAWSYNDTQHFKKATCEHLEETKDASNHAFEKNKCTVCNYIKTSVGLVYELNADQTAYTVISLGTCTDSFLTIPATYEGKPVTAIGAMAFFNANTITGVEILDGVTDIGETAFGSCGNLTSLVLPSSVKNIQSGAFSNCSKLVEVINKSAHITVTKNDYANGSVGLYALEVFNANDTYTNKFTTQNGYLLYNDGADTLLISYTGDDRNLVLPDGVTKIRNDAFRAYNDIVSVIIPDSVTKIGDSAFYNCNNLTSLTIGNGVKSIGNSPFYPCYKLVEIINNSPHITVTNSYIGEFALSIANCDTAYQSKLTADENGFIFYSDGTEKILVNYTGDKNAIVLPDGVTKIHNYAFYNNDSLVRVVISDSVTEIGNSAFLSCDNLSSVTIGNGVTKIGNSAFSPRYRLAEIINNSPHITITSSYIGDYALRIANRDGNDTSKVTTDENGFVTYCDGTDTVLVGYIGKKTSIVLPDAITKIHGFAFYNNNLVQSVVIPESVTEIGAYAFNDCDNLTSVTITKAVKNIGADAFSNCKKLQKVHYTGNTNDWVQIAFATEKSNPLYQNAGLFIDNQLVTTATVTTASKINKYAFYNYRSLKSITISNSVQSIEAYAFSVVSLETLYYTGNINEWVQIEFNANSANPLNKTVKFYIGNQLITTANITTATSINDYAFNNYSQLTSVTLGNGVQAIGTSAFSGCHYLTELVISESVTDIGEMAFSGCPIETATIPAWACSYIKNNRLNRLVINGGTSISASAFYDCTSLTSIVIPNTVTQIGANAFSGCPIETATVPMIACNAIPKTNLKTLVLTNGTAVAQSALQDCTKLISVILPDTVTQIEANAFSGCANLTSVTLGGGVQNIGENAFHSCFKLVEVINKSAHITVAKGGQDNGFAGCYALSVTNRDGNYISKVTMDTDGFVIYHDGADKLLITFVGEKTDITLPDGVTKIYNKAFESNERLTSVIIPDSVTEIGAYAFNNCTNLTSVSIGNGVKRILSMAFHECRNIANLTIGNGVESIGTLAFFFNLDKLENLIYTGTKAEWNAISKPNDWKAQNKNGNIYITCRDGKVKL